MSNMSVSFTRDESLHRLGREQRRERPSTRLRVYWRDLAEHLAEIYDDRPYLTLASHFSPSDKCSTADFWPLPSAWSWASWSPMPCALPHQTTHLPTPYWARCVVAGAPTVY